MIGGWIEIRVPTPRQALAWLRARWRECAARRRREDYAAEVERKYSRPWRCC